MPAAVTYPTGQLPQPSVKWRGSKESGVVSTKFASGHIRNRNRFDDFRREGSMVFEFTQPEFDMFQSWFYYKLDNGAADFNINLILDGSGEKAYQVTPLDGDFKWSHFGVANFRVTLKVMVLDAQYMDEATLDALLLSGDDPNDSF